MLTKETIRGMKKKDLVAQCIGDQNRLEYLQDKVQAKDLELKKFKNGLEELQTATEILLKTVALEKGLKVNGRKELWFPRKPDGLDKWDVKVERDNGSDRIGILLTKKE